MRTMLLLSLLLTTVPATVVAQRVPLPVGPGDRVLVLSRISPEQFEGIVMDVDQEILMIALRAGAPAREPVAGEQGRIETIPFDAIRTLHVYRTIDAGVRARSAVGWGLLGAGAGAVAGLAATVLLVDRQGSSGAEPVVGAFFGMLAGTAVGAVYGAYRPSPWDAVHLPNAARERR